MATLDELLEQLLDPGILRRWAVDELGGEQLLRRWAWSELLGEYGERTGLRSRHDGDDGGDRRA